MPLICFVRLYVNRLWGYQLKCAACKAHLTSAGLYQTVRRVLDTNCWYFMGTEYLECSKCHKKVAAWAQDIVEQLDLPHQRRFPAVLTYK